MLSKVGHKVRIITDCREAATGSVDRSLVMSCTGLARPLADGMFGIMEGDFQYGDLTSTEPVTDIVEQIQFDTNPRIRLDNGDTIWGIECWWQYVEEDMPTLEESKQGVREAAQWYINLINSVEQDSKEVQGLSDGE